MKAKYLKTWGLRIRQNWIQILVLPFISCANLGKFNVSEFSCFLSEKCGFWHLLRSVVIKLSRVYSKQIRKDSVCSKGLWAGVGVGRAYNFSSSLDSSTWMFPWNVIRGVLETCIYPSFQYSVSVCGSTIAWPLNSERFWSQPQCLLPYSTSPRLRHRREGASSFPPGSLKPISLLCFHRHQHKSGFHLLLCLDKWQAAVKKYFLFQPSLFLLPEPILWTLTKIVFWSPIFDGLPLLKNKNLNSMHGN